MIVPAAYVPLARSLSAGIAGPSGGDMFITALEQVNSPGVISHYISTGMIQDTYANLMADPDAIFAMTQQAGLPVTLGSIQALISSSDITEESPIPAIMRLGLQLYVPPPN